MGPALPFCSVLFRLRKAMSISASLLDSAEFSEIRRDIHRALQLMVEALKTEHRALPRQQLLLSKSRIILALRDAVKDSVRWREERKRAEDEFLGHKEVEEEERGDARSQTRGQGHR